MYIKFPLEQKTAMIRSIQEYVYREQGEEIGDLSAENHLEFILKEIAPFIYNEGVKDAKAVVEDRMMIIEEDLTSLERPVK
ncbi:DUF2164 domain-containing protein [Peribacillus cavernae]|uniref:DUF2164 domain-containing protein n=1 Tax=Peribacillus cavernae TaxID=1674310 RepID=A0A3S0VES0_9BACI|nr:DUF2164 domain-containing protein [Peribacillus cavernae]MDQ0220387.1 uncharacterized protein (DUF2164 family) [Peribacillus cavernae]RUQ25526.1 DUF2164 domain-containing protein [Peribacillus cavernae]